MVRKNFKKSSKAEAETPKIDLYDKVTQSIINALEAGVRPWMRPWNGPEGCGGLPVRANGQLYSGINVVLLWTAAEIKGFSNARWMTFNQAKELGGMVRKGEKATMIVYASRFVPKDEKARAERDGDKAREISMLKQYFVFNVEQIEGLPEDYYGKPAKAPETTKAKLERLDHLEAYFAATKADVRHGGNQAFWSPGEDFIRLPDLDSFKDVESYYATKGHEFIHWTGAKSRLNRDYSTRFGSEAYAAEELVAEMGSAFLCAVLGITPEVREDHAQYLDHWLKVLRGDKRFIFTAASAAQKAVTFLNGFSGTKDVMPDEDEPGEAEVQEAA